MNVRLALTKTVLNKYVRRIGAASFNTGWYYSTNENKYNLGIKALCCGIVNLGDKIELSNRIKSDITEDIKKEWNDIIDNYYVNVSSRMRT